MVTAFTLGIIWPPTENPHELFKFWLGPSFWNCDQLASLKSAPTNHLLVFSILKPMLWFDGKVNLPGAFSLNEVVSVLIS